MAKTRGTGLLMVWADIDPQYEAEYHRWYDEEHIAHLLAVPGFLSAGSYEALKGSPKYLALYELEHPDVLRSPAFLEGVRFRMSARPAFIAAFFRSDPDALFQHRSDLSAGSPARRRDRSAASVACRYRRGVSRAHRAARRQTARLHRCLWRRCPTCRRGRRQSDPLGPFGRPAARRPDRAEGFDRPRRAGHDRRLDGVARPTFA